MEEAFSALNIFSFIAGHGHKKFHEHLSPQVALLTVLGI